MNASSEHRLPTEPAALATEVVRRFGERLKRLIRGRISRKLRPRVDAEDVLQSAYRSFFLAADREQFKINTARESWYLLRTFAFHKLQKRIEWHTAAKRNYQRHDDESRHLATHAAGQTTPSQHFAVQELFASATGELSQVEREAMEMLRKGYSRDHIAREMKKSPRTVRRLLARCEDLLRQRLLPTPEVELPAATPLKYADYVLEKLVGAGGMGKVFRARDKVSGAIVGVKSLHKSRQRDPRAVERFVQESQILQRLSHPHIVRVEGLGQFPSGGHFMVMEFVEGCDLASHLARRKMDATFAYQVVRQIAEALAYAHAHGVIHGDLKPANVMLGPAGKVTVTDFGFAHLVGPNPQGLQSVGGTLGYMAPEVLDGSSHPTPASDVYSFGRLVRQLLTSAGTDPSENEAIEALARIARKCMALNPANRYRSASELQRALIRP
ncbi:protein kinase domain-containing protein [Aeoliella sp. SH292]|uniref:protein kinase domain-containing protein n=1 Tax=Aeoliella sp. SH292 TaxID=3454464 RepID=UPI003F98B26D